MSAVRRVALRWIASALLFATGTACLHLHPAYALAFDSSNLWPRGTELKVCFYNGGARERDFAVWAAGEWGKHGNLKFDFSKTPGGQNCNTAAYYPVRIVFADNATWTFPGPKAAQEIPRDKPTMSLGILGQLSTNGEAIARRTVLHEFGRLLGFLHEEQNPKSDCLGKLDWASIGKAFNTTREGLFGPSIEPSRLYSTEADKASIMVFSVLSKYLLQTSDPGDCSTAVANELSPIDKRGMAFAYPAGQSSNTVFVAAAVQPAPRTALRVMLEQRIGFGSILPAAVGEMTSALPAG